MEKQQFTSLFEGYWPFAKNYKAPKQQDLWAEIIDGIPDDLIQYALKRYARAKKQPPTVVEFEAWLWPLMDAWAARNPETGIGADWIRRRKAWREAEEQVDRKDPIVRTCDGCGYTIRSSDEIPPKRFPMDGGLVYKPVPERPGEWYALRCPLCGGPSHHRAAHKGDTLLARYGPPSALPVPPPDEWMSGEWVPIAKTPGGPMLDTLHMERILSPADPRFVECFAWQRRAVANSRAKIAAAIAAEQEAWEAEQKAQRIAAMEAKLAERAAAEDAAKPRPMQQALALAVADEDPESAPAEFEPGADLDEPAPDPVPDDVAPGSDVDDTPPF